MKDDRSRGAASQIAAAKRRQALALLALVAVVALVAVLTYRQNVGPRAGAGAGPGPAPASKGAPGRAGAPAAAPAGPASAPASRAAGPRVEVVVRAAWGSGPDELGHSRPQDGNPEGPMSFAVDHAGRVLVLDEVNSRVQVFAGGKRVKSMPLPADTFQDLDLRGNDLVLLDRLARQAVVYAGPNGAVAGEVPLAGAGVPEGGGVTGLFQRDDGTWVEVEHRDLVRVADASGRPDPHRPTMPGRPSGDGRAFLRAALDGREAAVVLRRARDAADFAPLARVPFPAPILHLTALESDSRGRVFLAASLLRRPADEGSRPDEAEQLVILGPDGAELGRAMLPPRLGPEEFYRPIRLGADGNVYQLSWDEHGVTMRRILP